MHINQNENEKKLANEDDGRRVPIIQFELFVNKSKTNEVLGIRKARSIPKIVELPRDEDQITQNVKNNSESCKDLQRSMLAGPAFDFGSLSQNGNACNVFALVDVETILGDCDVHDVHRCKNFAMVASHLCFS